MLKRLVDYIRLPAEVTAFERSYLQKLNRIALYFFLAHLPVFVVLAALCGTGPVQAAVLTSLVLVGPVVAYGTLRNPRHMSIVSGFTAMGLGGLLVHFGRGAMQIEMHFYFFVLIALLAVFANPIAVLTAAGTVAIHHLVMFIVLPRSVFNYDASYWAVLVHAAFVALEAVAACFVARSFFDNVIGLERIVERRTRELDGRNRAMRLVLDNVDQGFVTLSLSGHADRERSALAERWIGAGLDEGPVWEALARLAPEFGAWFEVAWAMVLDDFLPLDVVLDQLPKRLTKGDRVWSFDYKPICDDAGTVTKVLMVMTDITSEVSRERAEAEQRDFHHVFNHLMKDRGGFLEFFYEAEKLVALIQDATLTLTVLRRVLHTLKGNCGLYGLSRLAGLCHELETVIHESGATLSSVDRARVLAEWKAIAEHLGVVIGGGRTTTVEVEEHEIDRAVEDVRQSDAPAAVAERLLAWKLEPTERRLQRLAAQAQAIAARTGKGKVDVAVETNHLRLAQEPWREFWATFTHAIRNAVDHGVETPEERQAAGKKPIGLIKLATRHNANAFEVEISDDGRGVDWEAIRARAVMAGLPSESRADLIAAMFHDGLSTKQVVTEYSGRGVGMGALRAACQSFGGTMEILSTAGLGTTVRFSWPWEKVAHQGGATDIPSIDG